MQLKFVTQEQLRQINESIMQGNYKSHLSIADEQFLKKVKASVSPIRDGKQLRAIYANVRKNYATSSI